MLACWLCAAAASQQTSSFPFANAGSSDPSTSLPPETSPDRQLFVPWLDSRVASLVEPLFPSADPRLPAADSPQRLAYLVRRLLLRCSYTVRPRTGAEAWDDGVDVDQAAFSSSSSIWKDPALAAAVLPGADIRGGIERAVELAAARCSVLWWVCDDAGRPLPEQPQQHGDLGWALPIGYPASCQHAVTLESLLFPVGPPRRRRAMVLQPTLALVQQPFIPCDVFAINEFAQNMFGLVSQVGC